MCYWLSASGQPDERKGYIGISVGPAFPFGKFGSSGSETHAGFAKPGNHAELNFQYLLGVDLGIVLKLFNEKNSFDAASYPNAYSVAQGYRTEVNEWLINGFLAGAFYSISISKNRKMFYDGRLMVGFENASLPAITMSNKHAVNSDSAVVYSTDGANSIGFGVLFGSGIKYNLSSKFTLLLNAELSILNVYFRNIESTLNEMHFATEDFYQSMSRITLNAGIAYRLK